MAFSSALDETGADPVNLSVGIALGGTNYGGIIGTNASLKRLSSSTLDVQLGSGGRYTVSKPAAIRSPASGGVTLFLTPP